MNGTHPPTDAVTDEEVERARAIIAQSGYIVSLFYLRKLLEEFISRRKTAGLPHDPSLDAAWVAEVNETRAEWAAFRATYKPEPLRLAFVRGTRFANDFDRPVTQDEAAEAARVAYPDTPVTEPKLVQSRASSQPGDAK